MTLPTQTAHILRLEYPGLPKGTTSLAWASNSALIGVGLQSGNLLVYAAETGKLLKTLALHQQAVSSLSISPGACYIGSTGLDGKLRIVDEPTGGNAFNQERGYYPACRDVAFSPDGNLLALAGESVTLFSFPALSHQGHYAKHMAWHSHGETSRVAWSPQGKVVASGGNEFDGWVRVWDPATLSTLAARVAHIGGVGSLAFSPDGNLLAVGAAGPPFSILVWNWLTDTVLQRFSVSGSIRCLSWSPDGSRLLFSGQPAPTIRDLARERTYGPYQAHALATLFTEEDRQARLEDCPYYGLSCQALWSPVGNLIASVDDATLQVWSADTLL